MLFVDGENLAIRAAKVAAEHGITLTEGREYRKDVFVWLPGVPATLALAQPAKGNSLEWYAIRAHYYTSLVGDESKIREVRKSIRKLGFQPHVFKKPSQDKKTKGVDITLTKDLLVNGFQNNYDVAVLMAGDGDYVPVVEELKRMGRTVYVVFFHEDVAGLNNDLRWSSDKFFTLSGAFKKYWIAAQEQESSEPLREAKPSQEE
jgi:uncharacterized LabA/DUF88 family protein